MLRVMPTTYFISDLHLQASEPAMCELFFSFLKKHAINADALYILGDLFEFWVGDDDDTPLHHQVIEALHKLSQQTPIYFMHGNRDFLIGKRFLKATGCELLEDPSLIDLYGTKTLLMHGDLLCTRDVKYQKFRKFSRRWLVQKLFLLKSLKKRQQIAMRYRQQSQRHTATASEEIMDVTPSEVEKYLQHYDTPLIIHGHTHRPDVHHFTPCRGSAQKNKRRDKNKETGDMLRERHQSGEQFFNETGYLSPRLLTRIVLGAWHNRGSILVCRPDEAGKLRYDLNFFNQDELDDEKLF